MQETNMFIGVMGIVFTTLIGCLTYYSVVESNNAKEIVSRAIERGVDTTAAACAAQLTTNSREVRSTCEKAALIKGK
jgi:hypothetical protein